MRTLVLSLFLSSAVWANHFSSPGPGVRFDLKITRESLEYKSTAVEKRIALNPCKLKFALAFNGELLAVMPQKSEGPFTFIVDEQVKHFQKGSPTADLLTALETRLMGLEVAMNQACP